MRAKSAKRSAKAKKRRSVTTAAERSSKSLTNGRACLTDCVRERIETALNRVRSLLQADGITVELVEVRDNGASIRLTGVCVQCAAAPLNFQTGLEEMLRAEIEGFGELRLTTTSIPEDGDNWLGAAVPHDKAKDELQQAKRLAKA